MSKRMGQREIVWKIADDEGLPKSQVERIFKGVFRAIEEGLSGRYERVTIPEFGSFAIKQSPARPGRNPHTGARINIPARRRVKFMPSPKFKDGLNER